MKEQIRKFMDQGGDFNQTALQLAEFQRERNPQYGRLFSQRKPRHFTEIPAAPVGLFREISLTCFPPIAATAVFHTSGTTGKPGRHLLQDTELYDHGALKHAQDIIGAIPQIGVSLVTTSRLSSLSHMCRHFAPDLIPCFHPDIGVLHDRVWDNLSAADKAVFIPGTAFAFAALLDRAKKPCPLPEGSILMVTGGFKGKRTELHELDLEKGLKRMFPTAAIVGEYGMSELSSQLWAKEIGDPFIPPHWMRVLATDIKTGRPTKGPGQLRFVDLANHQTVMAIETMDHGIVHPDGSVTLLGRLPKARSRGCSLTVEEADSFFKVKEPPKNSVGLTANPTSSILPEEDKVRINNVINALGLLISHPPSSLDPTLSDANASHGLSSALKEITEEGLTQELQSGGKRPKSIVIVVAEGVFTAPLEWIAMCAASGASVHIKPPLNQSQVCTAFAHALSKNGLPVTVSVSRSFPSPDVIIAFGDNDTIRRIEETHPNSRVIGYGHRFSTILTDGDFGQAHAIARDLAAYDTRGCMAPAAIFAPANVANRLSRELFAELAEIQQIRPVGTIDTHLYPIIRRQKALARADGTLLDNDDYAVMTLPIHRFRPITLPRIGCIYTVSSWSEAYDLLSKNTEFLSSIAFGIQETVPPIFDPIRICKVGHLQRPVFPRIHDGKPMWASIAPKTTV